MKKLIATVIAEFKAANQNMLLDEDEYRNFKNYLDDCPGHDKTKQLNI